MGFVFGRGTEEGGRKNWVTSFNIPSFRKLRCFHTDTEQTVTCFLVYVEDTSRASDSSSTFTTITGFSVWEEASSLTTPMTLLSDHQTHTCPPFPGWCKVAHSPRFILAPCPFAPSRLLSAVIAHLSGKVTLTGRGALPSLPSLFT